MDAEKRGEMRELVSLPTPTNNSAQIRVVPRPFYSAVRTADPISWEGEGFSGRRVDIRGIVWEHFANSTMCGVW